MLKLWIRRLFRRLDPRRSVAAQLTFAILLIGIVVVGSAVFVSARSALDYLRQQVGTNLAQDARDLAVDLDLGMFERYRDIHNLAGLPAFGNPETDVASKRDLLNDLQSSYPLYAWIGFANTEGIVTASTGGLLENQSVAQRPWFQGGLTGSFVGDVHEALLLEDKLRTANATDEPLRFVDVAAAVYAPDGTVLGVLGAHLYWEWAEQLRDTVFLGDSQPSQFDVLVLDQQGIVLLGSQAGQNLSNIIPSAPTGPTHFTSTDETGTEYLAGYAATRGYMAYPGLGWQVMVRQPLDVALAPIRQQRWIITWSGALAILVFAAIAGAAMHYLLRPVVAITTAATRARTTNDDTDIPTFPGKNEIARLSYALHHFVEDLREQNEQLALVNRELVAANEKIQYDALHHELTGLPNRTLLADRIAHNMQRYDRHDDYGFALMHIDIDRFTNINQAFGRETGDKVLHEVAKRLKSVTRPLDTVAHLSTDEFAVLLDNVGKTDAETKARSIQQALNKPFDFDNAHGQLSTSVGVTICDRKHDTAEEVLRDAELATQAAKASGISGFIVSTQALRQSRDASFDIEAGLRTALDQNQLHIHFQPIVQLENGQPVGFEALVRWTNPKIGNIPPNRFIPIAEESGFIVEIDRWILHEACHQLRQLEDAGEIPNNLTLNVNLSPQQFTHEDLARYVEDTLIACDFPPERLKLEITEGLVMSESELSRELLAELTNLGIRLAIDDFGMGYSSLSYLQRLNASTIKIDRFFINNLKEDPETHALVMTMLHLADKLHMDVVAEGIETKEQAKILHALGCERGQGYLYQRPLPIEELSAYFAAPQLGYSGEFGR